MIDWIYLFIDWLMNDDDEDDDVIKEHAGERHREKKKWRTKLYVHYREWKSSKKKEREENFGSDNAESKWQQQ